MNEIICDFLTVMGEDHMHKTKKNIQKSKVVNIILSQITRQITHYNLLRILQMKIDMTEDNRNKSSVYLKLVH